MLSKREEIALRIIEAQAEIFDGKVHRTPDMTRLVENSVEYADKLIRWCAEADSEEKDRLLSEALGTCNQCDMYFGEDELTKGLCMWCLDEK